MERDRAWRRAQEQRIKRRVQHYWHVNYMKPGDPGFLRQLGVTARTRKCCACSACTNAFDWRRPDEVRDRKTQPRRPGQRLAFRRDKPFVIESRWTRLERTWGHDRRYARHRDLRQALRALKRNNRWSVEYREAS